jgi:hypothetical protein
LSQGLVLGTPGAPQSAAGSTREIEVGIKASGA